MTSSAFPTVFAAMTAAHHAALFAAALVATSGGDRS